MKHPYAEFVHRVEKPARYLGGEYQSVKKKWDVARVRFVLAFPDVYDIGMSHLGTKIIYALLNRHPDILCERAFVPWPDMEAELRQRSLPLLSLESAHPLGDFDHIGCSLQFELTYTNVLTLLDLGGVPLRAAERGEQDPLVWAGGPTATHAEPVAPFFDVLFIGEAEEALPPLLLLDAANKQAGLSRRERLVRLAEAGGCYVPALYNTQLDPITGFEVVGAPIDPRVPERVVRRLVKDLNQYPFPDDTPVPWAEAVFDRVSVEIARGCTEGCRFCQAGMIYRPVRERDPEQIVDAVIGGIKNAGYDETSLTALSTADVSCITPLVKTIGKRLREEKVSLSVSSLRAYGLNEDLLDEIQSVRATGLTFAPEAGTQRMRDVINKNVTEEDILRSAENVFSRGWSRMKLYFMIGLPTETDEDVAGIAQTGGRLKRRGKQLRRDADVTVSVSSHVPKPHTPFQWCAMDTVAELERKQRLLRQIAQGERVDFKWHEAAMSWLEGIFARGDRSLAAVIEDAWRRGARFDGWDEHFDHRLWREVLVEHDVDVARYLGTIPTDSRLPWDHIDIGLEDDFLLREYRKALKDRLSPPCGKPYNTLLHHTNVEEALQDQRKLVCYDCGVACDLTQMREERIVYLRKLGALHKEPTQPRPERAADAPPRSRKQQQPVAQFEQGDGTRYRIRYTKQGRVAFISHLDTARLLQRLLRRAAVPVVYSRGFHPKPDLAFGPALGLGIAALGELVDVRIDGSPDPVALRAQLAAVAPADVQICDVARLGPADAGLNRVLTLADYAALVPYAQITSGLATSPGQVVRQQKGQLRRIDVGRYLVSAELLTGQAAEALRSELAWPDGALIRYRVRLAAPASDGGPVEQGSARPAEVLEALLSAPPPDATRYARLGLWAGSTAATTASDEIIDPLDLAALRQMRRAPVAPASPGAIDTAGANAALTP